MVSFAFGEELVSENADVKIVDFPPHISKLKVDYSRFATEIKLEAIGNINQILNRNGNQIVAIDGISFPAIGSSELELIEFKKEFLEFIEVAYKAECSILVGSFPVSPVELNPDNVERYFEKVSAFFNDFMKTANENGLSISLSIDTSVSKPLQNTAGLNDAIRFLEGFYHKHENFGFSISSNVLYYERDRLVQTIKNFSDAFYIKSVEISEPYWFSKDKGESEEECGEGKWYQFNLPPNFHFDFEQFKFKWPSSTFYFGSMNDLSMIPQELYSQILCKLYSQKYMKLLGRVFKSPTINVPKLIQHFEEEVVPDLNSLEFLESNKSDNIMSKYEIDFENLIDGFKESGLYRNYCINEFKKMIGFTN
jgi:hypothetical protein